MVRYLFRRTPLRIFLLLPLLLWVRTAQAAESIKKEQEIFNPRQIIPSYALLNVDNSLDHLSLKKTMAAPRQHHAPIKSWSITLDSKILERPEITHWMKIWSSPEGLKKITAARKRRYPFRTEIATIIADAGMPPELIVIPIVESSWKTHVISSSGAAGPWQFLESTGRGRQLAIDVWRDERRNFWQSTEAAMKEFLFLYTMHKDWLLAIASYNAGATRIWKLRQKSQLHNFWDLLDAQLIPAETAAYLPQMMVIAYINAHAGRLGLPVDWEEPLTWTRIWLKRSILFDDLLRIADKDRNLLVLAHGELQNRVTPPLGKPYALTIPKRSADRVSFWLKNTEENTVPERFWRYSVRPGDSLSKIAKKSRVSLEQLLYYNQSLKGRVLRARERLLIPGNSTKPEGTLSDFLPTWTGRYYVQAGDSLWALAQRYGVDPARLSEVNYRPWNGPLHAGTVLRVPLKGEKNNEK